MAQLAEYDKNSREIVAIEIGKNGNSIKLDEKIHISKLYYVGTEIISVKYSPDNNGSYGNAINDLVSEAIYWGDFNYGAKFVVCGEYNAIEIRRKSLFGKAESSLQTVATMYVLKDDIAQK